MSMSVYVCECEGQRQMCGDDRDLLLYDVLQAQRHAQLALHLLPVGSTFCQVAHSLQGQGRPFIYLVC